MHLTFTKVQSINTNRASPGKVFVKHLPSTRNAPTPENRAGQSLSEGMQTQPTIPERPAREPERRLFVSNDCAGVDPKSTTELEGASLDIVWLAKLSHKIDTLEGILDHQIIHEDEVATRSTSDRLIDLPFLLLDPIEDNIERDEEFQITLSVKGIYHQLFPLADSSYIIYTRFDKTKINLAMIYISIGKIKKWALELR